MRRDLAIGPYWGIARNAVLGYRLKCLVASEAARGTGSASVSLGKLLSMSAGQARGTQSLRRLPA